MRFTRVLFWKAKDVVKEAIPDVTKDVGELTKRYSNLPESYIKRSMRQIEWETPRGNPRYLEKTIERGKFRFTTNRPWTSQFYFQNMPHTHRKKVFLEPIETWSWFRGDRVEILVGKDKGKQGIVSQVIQERNWVIVDGLNCHHRIMGKKKDYPGIIVASEAPLLVTKDIALVDPADLKSTPFEWRYSEDGARQRVSLRTGRIIPIPATDAETYDFKSPGVYVERPKDTTKDAASKVTFNPKLMTFEMEIMEGMGIKEDRVPKRSFWY